MPAISKTLIDKVNARFNRYIKILNSKLSGKFPADIDTKDKKIKWLINTNLRKYMTLTNGITKDGLLLSKNIPATYIKDLVKRQKVHKKYKLKRMIPTELGKMVTFGYLPKGRDTLPYYDIMPLVIPIEIYEDGFAGLNLHYVEPKIRILLLDRFYNYKVGTNEAARFKLLWKTLKSIKSLRLSKVIFKRYLYTNILTKVIQIPEYDWYIMPVLPSTKFVGKADRNVWKESIKKSRIR